MSDAYDESTAEIVYVRMCQFLNACVGLGVYIIIEPRGRTHAVVYFRISFLSTDDVRAHTHTHTQW